MARATQAGQGQAEAGARGERVEVYRSKTPPTSVVSIRVPNETLAALTDRARSEGISPGRLARSLLIEALESGRTRTATGLTELFSRWVADYLSAGQLDLRITESPQGFLTTSWFSATSSLPGTGHREVAKLHYGGRAVAAESSSKQTRPARGETAA